MFPRQSLTPRTILSLLLLATTASLHAQLSDPDTLPAAAAAPYNQAVEAEQQDQLDVALDRFSTALKQAPNSPLCMEAIARVQGKMGNDKAALATTSKMIATSPDALTRAHAEELQAEIYYRQWSGYTVGRGAYEKDPKRAEDALRKSEALLQHATADAPQNEPLRMLHAHVLAILHHDDDARREFTACAAIPGTSPTECARALKLAHDTDLSRLEPAPVFKATTLEGTPVSLDSLAGKVVLIDFWGSWCRYCVRDSDYIQSMLSSFDPATFVLLEINVGDTPKQWTDYIAKNRLKGVQAQDAKNELQTLFHVSAFPTYIVVDADGIIRSRTEGDRGDIRGDIRKLIPNRPEASRSLTGN
jgi:thiol-disulfide isomerase/thioredoxin